MEKLGRNWIRNGVERGAPHPLIQDWRWGGDQAFLRLNLLAEDIRMLCAVPGFALLVKEMKIPKQYHPTVHTLHSAAVFARGSAELTKFFSPSNDSAPDFELVNGGLRIPVEAKQLTQSEPERMFVAQATILQDAVIGAVLLDGGSHPEVRIVIKDSRRFPPAGAVVHAVAEALGRYAGTVAELRSETFNTFVQPATTSPSVDEQFTIQVLAPRDDSEDARVERLLNKANKQLKRNTGGEEPALMCLGLGRHQDPYAVASLMRRKFEAGDFRSTSAVLLHAFADYRGPGPRMSFDLVSLVDNPRARRPAGQLSLAAAGIAGDLLGSVSVDGTLSCYCIGRAQGRAPSADAIIGLDPVFRLPAQMFT